MAGQLYYDDVEVGMKIPPLIKHPTSQQLVKWAGASGDFYEIHYDKDFAISKDLPGIIVHGRLKSAFLGQMLTDWIGEQGTVKEISVQHRGMDFPGQQMVCKGTVSKKYSDGSKLLVECQIWTENPSGDKTVPGTAIVSLPSRAKRTNKS